VGRGQVTGFQAEAMTTYPDEASMPRSARAFSVIGPYLPSRLPQVLVSGLCGTWRGCFFEGLSGAQEAGLSVHRFSVRGP